MSTDSNDRRSDATEPTPSDPAHLNDADRREALRKLGALAAWTAPVMLTLMTSARGADDFGSPTRPGP